MIMIMSILYFMDEYVYYLNTLCNRINYTPLFFNKTFKFLI